MSTLIVIFIVFQCTVLLRGGTNSELMKVKKIISLMMFVAYNWRLERSFHIDSFAMPPADKEDSTLSDNSPSSDDFVEAKEQFSPPTVSPSRTDTVESISADSGVENSSKLDPRALMESSCAETMITFRCLSDCLKDTILSASPFISYPLPYLETKEGNSCDLRTFFPMEAYWSAKLRPMNRCNTVPIDNSQQRMDTEFNALNSFMNGVLINSKIFMDSPIIERKDTHIFTSKKLTSPIGSDEVQSLIADFRRAGGRLQFIPQNDNQLSQGQKLRSNNSSWNTLESDKMRSGVETSGRVDCLDPFLHQKLSVSFCSYSPQSANFPYFCVNPWYFYVLISMKF